MYIYRINNNNKVENDNVIKVKTELYKIKFTMSRCESDFPLLNFPPSRVFQSLHARLFAHYGQNGDSSKEELHDERQILI